MNNNNKINNFENSDEVSKKPLSEDELASLIKAGNQSTFNEVELKVKTNKSEVFKKVTLHDIAKQAKEVKKNAQVDKNIEVDQNTENSNKEVNKNNDEKNNNNIKKEEKKDKKIDETDNSYEDNDIDLKVSKKDEIEKEENIKIEEQEHLKVLEAEKQLAYEKGRREVLNEIKEGSDAAIAQLKKITETISKVEELDLKNLEKMMEEKVLELSSDLCGSVIKSLPAEFLKKIKKLTTQLENIEGNVNIFINEEDYNVIANNKNIKKDIEQLKIFSSKNLDHGEIELKVNGITIKNTIK